LIFLAFITNYQTYPAAEEGGEVTAEQQASNARQQPHEARQQAHEARQQALITNYQTRPAAQEGGEVTAQQQVSKARQQAHEARQQARRRARRVRQQEHEARQRTWTAWLFGASDRDSTDSEEGDSDVDFQQHVSLNGVRVEQRSGPMGRECDVRIFSQAEEGQRRDQEGTQRKIEQMGASLEKAAKLMERKGSEMSAALENAAVSVLERSLTLYTNSFSSRISMLSIQGSSMGPILRSSITHKVDSIVVFQFLMLKTVPLLISGEPPPLAPNHLVRRRPSRGRTQSRTHFTQNDISPPLQLSNESSASIDPFAPSILFLWNSKW